jgi:hypothetical protein
MNEKKHKSYKVKKKNVQGIKSDSRRGEILQTAVNVKKLKKNNQKGEKCILAFVSFSMVFTLMRTLTLLNRTA